jgi:diaminopropionate ammonia-lyase
MSFRVFHNAAAVRDDYDPALRNILSLDRCQAARAIVSAWPAYRPTPLVPLAAMSAEIGLGALWLKDESPRFGLGAFKAIGGAYAVYRYLESCIRARLPNARVSPAGLIAGEYRDLTSNITVACASAGNHGRAVAWGARVFGARAVVYLYQSVSAGRIAAIEQLGATVITTALTYDEALRTAAAAAAHNGWQIISDTAYAGYLDIPRTVMQGYTVIAQEAIEQLHGERPTHVVLQAGVGGFAAAIAAHFWETYGTERPQFIVVEPTGAACLLVSLAAGKPTALRMVSSIMGGLCCGEISLLGWEILSRVADWCIAIPDEAVPRAMRALATTTPAIVSGESGAAGIAALTLLSEDPAMGRSLGLDRTARVLAFSTEGATDPAAYHQLVNPLTVPAP